MQERAPTCFARLLLRNEAGHARAPNASCPARASGSRAQGDQSTAAASPLSPASSSSTATPSAHQGSLARSPGLHALLGDLVHEAERHAHKQAWRLALLDERVLPALVRALGLGTLRHTAR